jgi:isopentenyldiphosphate isomerase
MIRWLYIAAFYAWLGFTIGYFFRKWLEGSHLARDGRAPGPVGRASVPDSTVAATAGAGRAGTPVPPNPAAERVDWIDEQGRLLEVLPRAEIRRRNLLHRVTATFVFNPDGRLFIQQRTPTKDVYPGLFDVCVGGTVVSGESHELNACREIGEELGIHGVPVYALFDHRFADGRTNSAIRVYACVYDGPVTFQPEEVADGFWAGRAQVEALLAGGQVCPDSSQGWRLYLKRYGGGNFAREIAPGLEAIRCGGSSAVLHSSNPP